MVRAHVASVHAAYLDHVSHLAPGERAGLPLLRASRVTVVAAAARRLHLVATVQGLPPVRPPEVELHDEQGDLAWSVRFYDPSVLPELGMLPDDAPGEVRRALGLVDTVYHLTVDIGGGLDGHTALHSGVALANQHTDVLRDVEGLRHARPAGDPLVDELAGCVRLGYDRAAGLLVGELTSGRVVVPPGTPAARSLALAVADVLGERRG